MKLVLERLTEGALPIRAMDPEQFVQFLHYRDYGEGLVELDWHTARPSRNGRFLTPMGEASLEDTLKMFEPENLPDGATCYVMTRGSYPLPDTDQIYVYLAVAIEPKEDMSPDWPKGGEVDLDLLRAFFTLKHSDEEPEDPRLRDVWREIQQQHTDYAASMAESRQKSKEALKRSKALLLSMLNTQQQQDLLQRNGFIVTGQDGNRYFLNTRPHHNVWKLDEEGKPATNYCIVPDTFNRFLPMDFDGETTQITSAILPIYDQMMIQMMIQMMMLKAELAHFLETANSIEPDRKFYTLPQPGETLWGEEEPTPRGSLAEAHRPTYGNPLPEETLRNGEYAMVYMENGRLVGLDRDPEEAVAQGRQLLQDLD